MVMPCSRLVAPIRPEQVRLPTDRVREPTDGETFLLGQPYQPRELPPVSSDGTPPPAAQTKKDDAYGF